MVEGWLEGVAYIELSANVTPRLVMDEYRKSNKEYLISNINQ